MNDFSTETSSKNMAFKTHRKSKSGLDQKLCQFLFFSLLRLLWQTIKIGANFLCNSWLPLHKKWSFPLRIYSVNVGKSAENLRPLLERSLMENFIFCAVYVEIRLLLSGQVFCQSFWKLVRNEKDYSLIQKLKIL